MATRLSAGGGTQVASFNIAAGEAAENHATNLSGSHRPTDGGGSHNILSQAEYFADEMVLGGMEKREIMGVRVTRRMSLAMVACFCLASVSLIWIVSKALFGGRGEEDDFKPATLSEKEGLERFNKILNMLEPLTGTAISEEGTPEEKALRWLAYDDPARLDPDTHIDLLTQRFVLGTLWEATEGNNWDHQYSFRSHYDVCDWNQGSSSEFGAYCNSDGFVEKLKLDSNQLNGPLPRDIGLLTHLVHLDLKINQLGDHMPSSFGLLHKLTHLDLSENQMSGFAPDNAQKLTALEHLYLNNNKFQGEIPYEYLVDLPDIRYIDLSNNEFNGIVHDHLNELWGMDNLKSLDLSRNNFQGTVPPFLRRIDSLESLDFSFNSFTGTIPLVYGRMSNLEEFDVSHNKLTGSIPAEFGNTTKFSGDAETLEVFKASNNNLSGRIPTELGNIKNLGILMLDDNGLDGSIPTELGQLSELEILTLDNNSLTGSIPTELGRCRALIQLKISDNRLQGRLPSEMGEIEDLQRMDVRNNDLEGVLPDELKNLAEIVELRFNGNNFIGDLDTLLCARPALYPPWQTLESDCLEELLTCTCCTTCCNEDKFCCQPGTSSCNDA